jgi:hypothetical protein
MMRRPNKRPATSFAFTPTKASRMAEAITCAVMNPKIDPKEFERCYRLKLSDVLAKIEADLMKDGLL